MRHNVRSGRNARPRVGWNRLVTDGRYTGRKTTPRASRRLRPDHRPDRHSAWANVGVARASSRNNGVIWAARTILILRPAERAFAPVKSSGTEQKATGLQTSGPVSCGCAVRAARGLSQTPLSPEDQRLGRGSRCAFPAGRFEVEAAAHVGLVAHPGVDGPGSTLRQTEASVGSTCERP